MWLAVKIIIVVVLSYFFGNITFARPVSKAINDDITIHGSGNPGTMNMMRTYGAKLGFLTLLLDLIKGVVCCLCAYFIFGGKDGGYLSVLMEYIAGFCCFIGHLYPVVYKFKGGKGVATAAGIGFCINPILMTCIAVAFVVILFITEIASLTSVISVTLYIIIQTVIICVKHGCYWCLIPLWLIEILIIYAHRSNFVRLFKHTENKVHVRKIFKKKQPETSLNNNENANNTNSSTSNDDNNKNK